VRLLPLAEFTYNTAKHKAIGMAPFEADIVYVPWLQLDLLASDSQRLDSEEGLAYTEKIYKTLRILRERMEETQVAMTAEANEKQKAHPFRVGNGVFLDTWSLPIRYANVTGAANDSNNSRKFQYSKCMFRFFVEHFYYVCNRNIIPVTTSKILAQKSRWYNFKCK